MMKFKDVKRYLTIDKREINEYIALVVKARNAYIDERKPTEDVDELLCKLVKIKKKLRAQRKETYAGWNENRYSAKRVLSVLENSDMPIRAAVGLLDNVFIVDALLEDKDEYIGESDTDTDIYNFVVEHGYRHYDEIVMPGELPETVFIRMARCMMKKGGFRYED